MCMITVNSDFSITLNPSSPAIIVDAPISVCLNGIRSCELRFDHAVFVYGQETPANTSIPLNLEIGLPTITANDASAAPYDLISSAAAGPSGPWKDAHAIHVSTGGSGGS